MPNRYSVSPPGLARRPALAVVTANAVVMGVVGVSAPIGWILLPGVAAASARPRVAGVVAVWAAVLVAVSVVLPVVPGHRADTVSLATSAIFLAILPVLAWARERGYGRRGEGSGVTTGAVSWSTMRVGPFVVALAATAASRDVVGHVECADGRLRIVLGVLAGSVSSPRSLVHRLTRQFAALASTVDRALDEIAGELHATIQATSVETHLAATLIDVSRGQIAVLRCGGPEIIALPASGAGSPSGPCALVDPGPGALPLGLERPQRRDVRELRACARIAIVTSAFATSHYADYTEAVDAALRSKDLALAAIRLLVGPPGLDGWAPVVGPALVIAHQPPTTPQ